MKTKLYRYIGKINKLKPNGWGFQKLYARNYKSYTKHGIWMFVASKMVLEIENIRSKNQAKVVEFILENINKPKSFWLEKSAFFKDKLFPVWVIQNDKIITSKQAVANKALYYREFEKNDSIEYLEDGERIRYEWVQAIEELIDLGGVEI